MLVGRCLRRPAGRFWASLFLCIWVALAFWPGAASPAARATASSVTFIFSLFFFPLALIMAYVVAGFARLPALA